MGGYGTYLGYRIRAGAGDEPTFGTPDSAAELHPKLMLGCFLFFAAGASRSRQQRASYAGPLTPPRARGRASTSAGGQGGLLFNLLQNKPILESPHAVSALAGLALLGANGVLSSVMGEDPNLRTAHAFLGTSLMAVLVVHAALGLQLALSL